ncbi:MAG: TlpA family protein disulfide reductase [Leptothrix sp. (in: b-proteobacteria)]
MNRLLRRRDWLGWAGRAALGGMPTVLSPAARAAHVATGSNGSDDDWPDDGAGGNRSAGGAPIGSLISWPELTWLDGSRLPASAWQDCAAVVAFWATWCPYCRRHNAHIEQLHQRASGPHLRVLGVALDADANAVRRHVEAEGLNFPVTLDGGQLRARFSARRVVPLTCVVDRSGRLRHAIPGEMSAADVRALAGSIGASA